MTDRIFWASIFLFFLPSLAFSAETCGKIAINDTTDCHAIVATFNLVDCGQGSSPLAARITCASSDIATASVKTPHGVFQARLRSSPDWGNTWLVDGSVTRVKAASLRPPMRRRKAAAVKKAAQAERQKQPQTAETSMTRAPAAATPMPAVPVAPPTPQPDTSLSFSGYLDTYYSYNFNQPQPVRGISGASTPAAASLPPGNNQLRLYDVYANQFNLNMAELTVKKTGKEVSMLVDLDFGEEADLNAAASSAAGNTVDDVSKHIGQAYLTYKPSGVPGLTIDAGKMYTHLGLETAKAKDDWQYSRSVLYSFGIPIWHAGIHVGYETIPSRLTLNAYLYNGWNTLYSNNSSKTEGAQVNWTPTDAWTVVYNYIGGPEEQFNDGLRRTVHEVNAAYVLNPRVAFAGDALAGMEGGSNWQGYTLATKLQVRDWYWVSPRGEIYRDPQGFTLGAPQNVYGVALTNGFEIAQGLESRFELRRDLSTSSLSYLTSNGTSGSQTTGLISFLYSF